MPIHLEHVVEVAQHSSRTPHIDSRQGAVAQYIHHGDGVERRARPVSRDIDQVHREALVVQGVVAEAVSTHARGGLEAPVDADVAG
jgi:hypothetical protein